MKLEIYKPKSLLLTALGALFGFFVTMFFVGFLVSSAEAHRRKPFKGSVAAMAKFVYVTVSGQFAIEDEGTEQGTGQDRIDCVGAGVVCSASGTQTTVTVAPQGWGRFGTTLHSANLQGYWQLDGDLTDSSGNSGTLTKTNGTTLYTTVAPGIQGV